MTLDGVTRTVADDLEEIAASIPQVPAGLGILRQQLALLPNPLAATLQPNLPAQDLQAPAAATDTMAGDPPGMVSGASIQDGTIATPQIAPGAITGAKMATDVKPIAVVASLPALPDPAYPVNTWVYVTGDHKLYKNVAEAWVYVINPGEITATQIAADTITAGQIAAGAIGTSELAVGAVLTGGVANAASSPSVVINSSGITITDGALVFQDAGGTTVLDQYGFGRPWLAFLARGFYNADFATASTSDIPASEVSSGDSLAHYQSSLSALLPYWVVSESGGTLKQVTDSTMPAGVALQSGVAGTDGTDRIYQDIPIMAGTRRAFKVTYKATYSSGTLHLKTWYSYRKSDHSIIGSRTALNDITIVLSAGPFTDSSLVPAAVAALTAAYIRFEIEVVHTGAGTNSVNLGVIESNAIDADPNLVTLGVTKITAGAFSGTGIVQVQDDLDVTGDLSTGGDLFITGNVTNTTLSLAGNLHLDATGTDQQIAANGANVIEFTDGGAASTLKARGILLSDAYADGTPGNFTLGFGSKLRLVGTSTGGSLILHDGTAGPGNPGNSSGFTAGSFLGLYRQLTDIAGRRNWGFATEQVSVGDLCIMVSNANNTGVSAVVGEVLTAGNFYHAMPTKAGTWADADYTAHITAAVDGAHGFDTTNHRFYFREGGGWHYVARTAGFLIPELETHCPVCLLRLAVGDDVIGQLDHAQDDGALHGLWKHASCAGKPLDARTAQAYRDAGEEVGTSAGRRRVKRALDYVASLA